MERSTVESMGILDSGETMNKVPATGMEHNVYLFNN